MSADNPRSSVAFLRLRWQVAENLGLVECIHIADDPNDVNSTVSPYQNADGTLHPIHTKPISYPPVKRFKVVLDKLDGFQLYNEEPDYEAIEQKERNVKEADGLDGWAGPFLHVTSSSDFITAEKYINAVFPLLVSLRADYIRERSDEQGDDLPESMEIWVNPMNCVKIWLTDSEQDDFDNRWNIATKYYSIRKEWV